MNTKTAALCLVACLGACGAPPDDQSTETTSQEILASPPDKFTGWITVWEGTWGTWRQEVYCNNGWLATGFQQRVEPPLGSSKDDTALNSVTLRCKQQSGPAFEFISSHDGWWGNWGSQPICPGGDYYAPDNWVNGARLKVEPSQGGGDDTGGNAAQMSCINGGTVSADNDGPWGNWQGLAQCGQGQAVCGIRIKVEPMLGSDRDDTAMNGLKLACCTL
jgi:hypothetical protein